MALASCGGGGGGSTSSDATSTSAQAVPHKSEAGKGQSSSNSGEPKRAEGGSNLAEPASPAQHHDSGGGSAQFRVKGGDNSIPEYGAEAGASERARAARALHGFFDARAGGEWQNACSYLASQVTKGLEELFAKAKYPQGAPKGCAGALAALSAGVPHSALVDAAEADVGSLRSNGSRGFLLYHGAHHIAYEMPMAVEGGRWKVNALQGSELL
jgi:hypothetical protein